MRLERLTGVVVVVTAVLVCVLATAGCGSKKKRGGLTIEQLRTRALAQQGSANQARELVKVARLQARATDSAGASQTLSKARGLLTAKSASADGTPVDPAVAGPSLVDIAEVYALVGERATAKDTLAQARRLVPEVTDPVARCRMLAEAGGIYGAKSTGLGDASSARAVLAEAAAIAAEVDDRFRPESLAAVATGYLAAGLATEAVATADALEQLAKTATDRPKVEGLAVAATVRGQSGDADAARSLLAEAGATAKAIASPENRAYALVSVARATGSCGDSAIALALLEQAEKAAGMIGDADAQKNAGARIRAVRADIEKRK